MSIRYHIDADDGVVFSTAAGRLEIGEVLAYMERLRSDPAFSPAYRQLFDFRAVTEVALDSSDLAKIAERNVFGAGTRRAFVASQDVVYGLARMFQVYVETPSQELRVFREIDEARRWLGLAASEPPGS